MLHSRIAHRKKSYKSAGYVTRSGSRLSSSLEKQFGRSVNDVDIIQNPTEGKIYEDIICQFATTEGWNYSINDYTCYSGYDDYWFFFAVEKVTRQPVASVFVVRDRDYDGKHPLYSIAWYYCTKEWRGCGVGTKLFQKAMAIAGSSNTVLHAVPTICERYRSKYGFVHSLPFAHISAYIHLSDINFNLQSEYIIKNIREVNFDEIIRFDRTICPRNRQKFLKRWLTNMGNLCKIVLDRSGRVIAICCVRQVVTGTGNLSVCPLYASSLPIAKAVLLSTVKDYPGEHEKLFFHYPSINTDAERLISDISNGKHVVRAKSFFQFTKKIVPVAHEFVFSITEGGTSLC